MEYLLDIEISMPREQLVALFRDQDSLSQWQPGLVSVTPLSGTPGQAGAQTKFIHKMGFKQVEMQETIEAVNLPDEIILIYEAKGVWNRCVNRFIALSAEQTQWEFGTEFRFSGMMRLLVLLMPSLFKKQSRREMENFKAYAEQIQE